MKEPNVYWTAQRCAAALFNQTKIFIHIDHLQLEAQLTPFEKWSETKFG